MDAVRAPAPPLSLSTATSPQMPATSGGNLGGEVYVLEIDAACREGKFRRLVVCPLEGRVSVRAALQEAAREFERLFGGRPQFGFMRKMPVAVGRGMWEEGIGEWGVDSGVVLVGDLVVLEVDWMLERCVAVGCKTPLSLSTATSPQIADERRDLGGEKKGA